MKSIAPRESTLTHHGRRLVDDGIGDTVAYNEELAALGDPKYFNVAQLYAECYLFR